MPGKIKVKVLAGRNLPVMDRASDTTDAFVEIKFGGITHKTDVCRKSLNPHWNNTEWYRFEVDESELQDEPLQLRLMDHDTYSANDAIGKVVISLAPLLSREPAPSTKGAAAPHTGAVMSGWIPVFDTMHGIRGELNVIVKVELFSDFNKYKTSSCGVQFFYCPVIPPGYRATAVHGFVEELVVNDDPEYQWMDKIRTPRASNEARQAAFIKLSNQVQRLVGLKAAELGANAVVGYQQSFDLEGDAGVVARAIGTAISIVPLPTPSQPTAMPTFTQQQLKKYLDILSTDNESITDLNEYFQTHQDELQKLMHILHPKLSSNFLDEQEKDEDETSFKLTRQSSIKSYTDSVSIYQDDYISQNSLRNIAEDQSELNKLLYHDKEEDEESDGPFKRIKKLKPTFFSKRFGNRSRKSEKQSDDQISIKSNSSDASRISLAELRNEFKKLKRLKKPKFRRTVSDNDDGIGMASILARSVIHAHTSLACIAETQDSEHSPSSTLRRTSESEPTINMSDDERIKINQVAIIVADKDDSDEAEIKKDVPEIHFSSMKNVNVDDVNPIVLHRKLSESCPNSPMAGRTENFLKLPGEVGYYGSISSALSGDSSELFTTSDEDDESSEVRTDTEKSIETTSSVVQTVLKQQVDPVFISQIEKTLSDLDFKGAVPTSDTTDANNSSDGQPSKIHIAQIPSVLDGDYSIPKYKGKSSDPSIKTKSNNAHRHFKFHIPFTHKKADKSFSAPSSPVDKKSNFVYRSSIRFKRQISKLSKTSMIKSLSHYSLLPKKKHVEPKTSSQHSSASDVPSKGRSHETVLGSHFLSYSDLLTLDKENADIFPYHPKTDERETKVHMYIGSEPVSRASISGPSSPRIVDHKENIDHENKFHKKDKHSNFKSTGLLHTAMETILMDKVQSLLIPTSPEPAYVKGQSFFEDVNQKLEKFEELRSKEVELQDKGERQSAHRKLLRQDSVHSLPENAAVDAPSNEFSNTNSNNTNNNERSESRPTKSMPVLQHFHPIMSGSLHPKLAQLETIPSLPENSFDREFSIDDTENSQPSDVEPTIPTINVEQSVVNDPACPDVNLVDGNSAEESVETNNNVPLEDRVVCDNSHAACRGPVRREKERDRDKSDKDRGSPRHARHESYGGREPVAGSGHAPQNTSLTATSTPVGIHRRSSDSDLSVTPKGSSLNASGGNTASGGGAILKPSMNSNNIDLLEYPFLTMTEYPSGFIVHIGGTVCARSVKLVDGGGESATRTAWWTELRTELRAHARALRCNAVLAYTETTAICEDVCVLSASGTAAVINLDCDFDADLEHSSITGPGSGSKLGLEEGGDVEACSAAHVPYSAGGGTYRAELMTCAACRRARVPGVLLATCARPRALRAHARATTLTAVAARVRRAPPQAEPGARDISDQLPFLEYELHKLLLAKLRMQGANALFSLQTQIAIGERCVVGLASGVACRLAALPPPAAPRIKASESDKEALELQKALWDTFAANKAANGYDVGFAEYINNGILPEADNEESPVLDLCADKDACVLELDEAEDVETAKSLSIRRHQLPVLTQYLEPALGANPYAFTQVWRARFTGGTLSAERQLSRAQDCVQYKLRTLVPCATTPTRFQIELAEDEIQLVVSGAAIPLTDPNKPEPHINGAEDSQSHDQHPSHTTPYPHSIQYGTGDGDDDIFTFDEEQGTPPKQNINEPVDEKTVVSNGQVLRTVALTPLPGLSGARRQRWVCALQLLFVRETTSVRELGGLSGFLHTFMCEVLAIVRAHTAALGGNALTSFYITQLMLQDNAHKNQGQCLLSVGGDVVHITY